MQGTGYFPIGYDQAYKLPEDDLFLIGTSEVSLVSYHEDETLQLADFPIKYAGISSCYRREAGTYGRDTRGLYRVHQFQKVEQVVFCEADDKKAEALHYEMLENAETILQVLELPYRVCLACTGEIGIGQIRKHEIEACMKNFESREGIVKPLGNCIVCYRCINRCPQKAIIVLFHRRPKWQYKGVL